MRPRWSVPAYIGATLLGLAFAAVPRRLRFPSAVFIARVIGRLLPSGPSVAAIGTRADVLTRVVARAMMWTRTRYDPCPRVDAPPDVIETVRQHGAIFVTGHFPLMFLLARWLFDRGLWPAIVKAFPDTDPFIWGTTVADEVIVPSPTILLRLRAVLREKRPVVIAVDGEGNPRSVAVQSPAGEHHVSTVSFDFARKLGVPMFFACPRIAGREAVLTIRRIEPAAEAFLEHYRAQIAAIR